MFSNIVWFVLNLFFFTGERLLPQLVRSASNDRSKVSSVAAPRDCYEPENKWKCSEPERERMSDYLNGNKWHGA